MIVLCLLCWGPIPLACLWLGSEAQYLTGSVSLGILAAFVAAVRAAVRGARAAAPPRHDVDPRPAGRRTRPAHAGRWGAIFAATAAVVAIAFAVWFLVIHGPGNLNTRGG